ncbi:MAG: alpha/beta fold hydrolase [Thaumarchaeota archaeon]|nr:alpha/beta fold hydrolase [Nitrososphaerota archaeon]
MPTIRTNGVNINYDAWGEGPAMMLIHANPFDNTLWLYQAAHFSTYYQVICTDVRGYGRSDKPESNFSIKDLSEDVVAVCKQLNIDKAIFGGISVGASILQQLAADHPELVRALILAGTSHHPPGKPRTFAEKRINGYSSGIGYRETHLRSLVTEEFQKTKLGAYLISMFLERNPTTNAKTIAKLFEGYRDWQQPQEIGLLKCPTLIVVGEKDPALKGSFALHQNTPRSELAVIKDAGHACCIENPSEFDVAVMAFLERHGLLPTGLISTS